MAKVFISEIQPNQEVITSLVVAEKQLRTARNGTPFLTLKLVDKTGEVVGRIWERAEEVAEAIPVKGAVHLRGRSEMFRDELQLQIQEISALAPSEIDPADFLPVCPESLDALYERFRRLASGVKRRPLHQLMKQFVGDRELMDRFKLAPAAKSMHHAYLGGLLEHTVAVVRLVAHISEHYPDLDRDLLVVGAFLHDIGKVHEFVYDLCIDYSHEGRLVGHIVLGVQILEEKLRSLKGFPAEEALLLKHLILSHHGQPELGAARLPMTREAFVLHFADDLDAKMNCLGRVLAAKEGEEAWTAYQPLFNRFFFRGFPSSAETAAENGETQEDRGIQLNLWSTERTPRSVS